MGIIKLVIDSMCPVWHWKSRKTIPSGASAWQAQLQREMKTFTKDGARRRRREKEKSLYALNLNWDICNHIHSYCSCLDVYAWARDNYAINHFILFSFSCFSDLQFPIDLNGVEKDHPFLEKDQLQALYRRLAVLNRSATMRLDGQYNRNVNVCCRL